MKKLQDWMISNETLIEITNHPKEEIWIEEHENEDNEMVFVIIDTSGCNYGYGVNGVVEICDSFEEASNKMLSMV